MAPYSKAATDPAVWAALKVRFEEARDLPEPERHAYLQSLEAADPTMAKLLGELLESCSSAPLSSPPWQARSHPDDCQTAGIYQPGDVLQERFEIEETLGRGGSGEVYRAYDRHRKVQVAIKALWPSRLNELSSVESLRHELNIATRISHPNVCRVFDICIASAELGARFLTMELLTGETLSARIRRSPLSTGEAYPIVQQLINGLAAAHELGIAHGDLKSVNILLTPASSGCRAVITDFGLAREIRGGAELSATISNIAGTPAYMPPEQLQGKPPSRATDIYALGVVMFEMVTRRLPFEGETPLAIAAARLNSQAPSPRRYVPALDTRWEHAILTCLERDAERRPASVFEILSLLETPPARQWPRRALAGLVVAGVGGGVYFIARPPVHSEAARAAFERGLIFNQRRTAEGVMNAIREFRRAAELEPRWAEAWSNLADAYGAASNGEIIDPATALAESRTAARRAIALNGDLARAHGSLGWALSLDLDEWPNAEREFQRAQQLNSKDADVCRWFAIWLRKAGRFREAERQLRIGLQLTRWSDPRIHTELAFLFFTSRQTDRFLTQIQEAHSLFPNDSAVEFLQAKALEIQGKYDQAFEVLTYVERLGMTHALVLALKAGVAVSKGDSALANGLAGQVDTLSRTQPVDGLVLAGIYARLGQVDRAFAVISEAYRRRDNTLLSLATSPWMDPLRSSALYREWLQRLHFTPQIMQRMEFNPLSPVGRETQPRRTGTS